MNRIGVQTSGPAEHLGIPETYRKIREWGFDAVDVNINDMLVKQLILEDRIPEDFLRGGRDFLERFRPFAEASRETGVENGQAHAPIPSMVFPPDSAVNGRILEMLQNVIRACDLMNCRILVVHPFFPDYAHRQSTEDEWNINMESYSSLIPAAREYGVTICLENIGMRYKGKFYHAFTSDIGTACRSVDELNALAGDRVFGFCLDTGHMLIGGLDAYRTVTQLGSRIRALHIHDNDGDQDLHLAPYMGILDWDRLLAGLKAIDFRNTLSFETYNMWNRVDPEVCGDMMRYIAACGKMFARRISE